MSTRQTGYEARRTQVLGDLLATVDGGSDLSTVYEAMTGYGHDGHEIWTGIRELEAGGMLAAEEDAGRTYLEARPGSIDDLPGYAAASGEAGEDRVVQRVDADWTGTVNGRAVPTLRADLAADFFDRHGWDADRATRGYQEVATGARETEGGVRYRLTVVNDHGAEQDRITVRAGFPGSDVFAERHRASYARRLWTPLTVLQQRNAWITRSADRAVDALPDLVDGRETARGRDLSPADAVADELSTLGKVRDLAPYGRVEFGMPYGVARDAAVDAYTDGAPRPSRIVLPFAAEVESRVEDDGVVEGALPLGSDESTEKVPELLGAHLDEIYREAKRVSP